MAEEFRDRLLPALFAAVADRSAGANAVERLSTKLVVSSYSWRSCEEGSRSEEHTSELQSLRHLVCRLLLDTAAAEIYTLSLHDALPICSAGANAVERLSTKLVVSSYSWRSCEEGS